MDFPPSLAAAAVLVLARRRAGTSPFWPDTLARLTGRLRTQLQHRLPYVEISKMISN